MNHFNTLTPARSASTAFPTRALRRIGDVLECREHVTTLKAALGVRGYLPRGVLSFCRPEYILPPERGMRARVISQLVQFFD
ncbi:hypothetical protein AB3G45_17250 [Shinella sp. S4-D37]|uniref:hypothetical protein n=1 Tax=Shinella sp. S4-D37 TaxID=3161999 RepID=UPI003467D0F0